jgi:hypothetical protein
MTEPTTAPGLTARHPGSSRADDRIVFLLGSARSGTTWLAKILDSHPGVLYRHEPDIALQDYSFPTLCEAADIESHRPVARAYLERLLGLRSLKTMGGLPVFRKAQQGRLVPMTRLAMMRALQALERIPPLKSLARSLPIPDFVDPHAEPRPCIVVKSVSALGRAGLYAAAMPEMSIVLILRHPCGQVASMLRGRALGKFEGSLGIGGGAVASTAQRYGLTPEHFATLTPAEQHAWDWAIMNEFAMDQLRDHARVKIVRYEDFCADPAKQTQGLLDYCGLQQHPQTERFIAESSQYQGKGGYYQVFRNARESVDNWRKELHPDVQRSILNITGATRVGKFFRDNGSSREMPVGLGV